MSDEEIPHEDIAFCFTPNPKPWFYVVIIAICSLMVLIGIIFLYSPLSPLGVAFIGAGIFALIFVWNDSLKNRYRSVTFDGTTIRVQDSRKDHWFLSRSW